MRDKCFFCDSLIKKDESWKMEVKTAEGVIKKSVCKECADIMFTIEAMRELIDEDE